MTSPYDDFSMGAANFVPLSPLSFLPRTASIYPDDEAIIHGKAVCLSVQLWCHVKRYFVRRKEGKLEGPRRVLARG